MSVNSKLKAIQIIDQREAFYRQKILEFSCAKKYTAEISILITSRNGDRKIMQFMRIMSKLTKKSTNHFLPESTVSLRSNSSSKANPSYYHRSDAWWHLALGVVSSGMIARLQTTSSGSSLKYSKKSVGQWMEPWGTPALIGYCNQDFPYRATQSHLLLRKKKIRPNMWPEIP